MFEIDFLPVGQAGKSGDAICMQFTRPDTGAKAVVVIDAGYKEDGEALVEHIKTHYGTTTVDLAILTHPDADHIGGMGEVVRNLYVTELWLHDIGAHGGASLPAAAAVDDLISVARDHGTTGPRSPSPGRAQIALAPRSPSSDRRRITTSSS